MIPWDLTYDFPFGVFLLFALVLIALAYALLDRHRKKVIRDYTGDDSERLIVNKRRSSIYWFKVLLLSLVWTLATFALMQPKGNGHYAEEETPKKEASKQKGERRRKHHSITFLIDASASMAIRDARGERTRLESAQDIADQISSEMTGQTASLYAFTSDTTRLSPPSMDYFFLRMMLKGLQINEGDVPGTDIVKALQSFKKLIATKNPSELKTLILISDGGDTKLETLNKRDQEAFISQISDLFNDAEKLNLRIYTIGTGSPSGGEVPAVLFEGQTVHSKLNEEILQKIAEKARGKYYPANEKSPLEIARDIFLDLSLDDPYVKEDGDVLLNPKESLIYTLYFQIPLGLAILLLALVIVLPEAKLQKAFKKIGMASFFLFVFPLYPNSDFSGNSGLKEACLYFEAKDYSRSIGIYNDMLRTRLTPWEQGVVSYNLATSLLKNGDLERSQITFESIAKEATLSPLMRPSYEWNLGLTYYEKALRNIQIKLLSSSTNEEDSLLILFDLRKAHESIQKSLQAKCSLEALEGTKQCSENMNGKRLIGAIRLSLFQSLKRYQDFRLHELKLQDKVEELLNSTNALQDANQFMRHVLKDPSLKESYSKMFSQNIRTWLPFWEGTEWKLVSESQKDAYKQAKQKFVEAIQAFEKNDFSSSEALTTQAEKLLSFLKREDNQGESFSTLLERLIIAHQRILTKEPIMISSLLSLQNQLKNLTEQASKLSLNSLEKLYPDYPKNINESLELVKASLNAANQSKAIAARMYLQASKRLLEHLNFKPSLNPQEILDEAIEDQKNSLNLNRLIEKSDQDEALSLLVKKVQQGVLETAFPFVQAVKVKQEELFSKETLKNDPWKETLENFNAGFQAAADAAHLQLKNPEESLKKQQEALRFWEKTKETMESQQKQEETPKTPKDTQEKESPSIDETLQLLQEMQKDDQIRKKAQPLKEVQRPW